MRLTKHILDQISWWEHIQREHIFSLGYSAVFTLHFRQWWKPRKVLRIPYRCVDIDGGVFTYRMTEEAEELLDQLRSIQ